MSLASSIAMNWRHLDQPSLVPFRLFLPAVVGTALLCSCGSDDSPTEPGGNRGGAAGSGAAVAGSNSNAAGATANGFDCNESAEPGEVVSVPGGDFLMGCNETVDSDCSDDETPSHTLTMSPFEIDATEVTQLQYTACVVAGACEAPACEWNCDAGNLPASCLTWGQANAYCTWANKRLPTEAEWEKAARGDAGNKYPWGDDEPTCELANMANCGERPMPVGSLDAGKSPYGAFDMAGNVVEYIADFYDADYYANSPTSDPKGPETGMRHGGRGGGFKSDAEYLRVSKRDWYDATDSAVSLGFRCAR
jgi:formylglycine-generating enzyme required for sulfatase activity